MRMTPEDRFDRQPLRAPSGALITADARLDNRDDLLSRLGTAREMADWPDSRIILAAWERFGDAIWPDLRGPFAIAIWNPADRSLTLSRDHLGLNVVMWHRTRRFFAFATMPKGLFALPDVPRQLNEDKFADFLVLNHADHATTMYQGVQRLLPAHAMRVTLDGTIAHRRYWSAADIRPVRLSTDEAYSEAMRETLDRAVRRQMRSIHPIGCHVTGGLDSSSVAALAARALGEKNQRLAAFTHVPRRGFAAAMPSGSYADERPYVESICGLLGNIDVTYVHNDEHDDFAELERLFLAFEAPVRNPLTLGWMLAISRLARAQGRRVLLGGLYGNCTISWDGWSQTAGHMLGGRLLTAYRQWRQFYRCSPHSRRTAARKLLVDPLLPQALTDWIDRRDGDHIAAWQEHSAIRPDIAVASGVGARAVQAGHDFLYRWRPDERTNALTPVDYAGDWFAAEKAITGVEVRDPTADIDVVSFCFGVPPEQYLAEGIDRSLIRRAMWGLLPESVLTSRARGMQSPDWYEKLERRRDELRADIKGLATSQLAARFVDFARLEQAIAHWPDGDWYTRRIITEYQLALPRGVAAARFLRWIEATNRPQTPDVPGD
jgi:asparagine synthase (glutamine-hydrolysing)